MSEHGHGGHCRDCGGTGGHHYNGCIYDGVDSGRSHRSSLPDSIRWIPLIGAVIFMGLFPPLGVLLIIFLIGSLVAAGDGDYSGIEAIGKFVGFVVLMLACMWILTNPVVLVLVIVIIIVVSMVSK